MHLVAEAIPETPRELQTAGKKVDGPLVSIDTATSPLLQIATSKHRVISLPVKLRNESTDNAEQLGPFSQYGFRSLRFSSSTSSQRCCDSRGEEDGTGAAFPRRFLVPFVSLRSNGSGPDACGGCRRCRSGLALRKTLALSLKSSVTGGKCQRTSTATANPPQNRGTNTNNSLLREILEVLFLWLFVIDKVAPHFRGA